MIKLKELLELRTMGYYKTDEEVKKKHKKRMEQQVSLFDNNLVLPRRFPPENDSSLTLKEVKELSKIKPNKEFVDFSHYGLTQKDVESFFKCYNMRVKG